MKYLLIMFLSLISFNVCASVPYQEIQERWDIIKFIEKDKDTQIKQIQILDKDTESLLKKYPNSAELWALSGIIKATKADLYRNIRSIGLLNDAKLRFEKSIKIDERALNAAANSSLAALYYKTPSWPLGMKDFRKAEILLKKSLKFYPKDVEANYFYADYLIAIGKKDIAQPYFKFAVDYPIRPNRYKADVFRKQELARLYNLEYKKDVKNATTAN